MGPYEAVINNELITFAKKVRVLAKEATGDMRYGDRKVFISYIQMGFTDLLEEDFKELMMTAHRKGLIQLRRADYVPAMDLDLVRKSEICYLCATFHFILVPEFDEEDLDYILDLSRKNKGYSPTFHLETKREIAECYNVIAGNEGLRECFMNHN